MSDEQMLLISENARLTSENIELQHRVAELKRRVEERHAASVEAETRSAANLAQAQAAERERDEARAALGKLYAGRRLSPAEHDLARDCLPQSALEGP